MPVPSSIPAYAHYNRIAGRICRSLDRIGTTYDREAVTRRLRTYYLFIGLCDDALDSSPLGLQSGEKLLAQVLSSQIYDEDWAENPGLAPILREFAALEISPEAQVELEATYHSVLVERAAPCMRSYLAARETVGRRTAEVSYLLIAPWLAEEPPGLRQFFSEVGAVGCLVDSVVDLRADLRSGLINFRPSLLDYFHLYLRTTVFGLQVLLKYPNLLLVFGEAILDTFADTFCHRRSDPAIVPA